MKLLTPDKPAPVLVNAEIGQVKSPKNHLSGLATYRDLGACVEIGFGHKHGFARAALPEMFQKGLSDTHSLEPRIRPRYGFTRAETDEHFRISVPQERLLRAHKALSPLAVTIGWDEPRG